jgi:hypothetical protein
MRCESVHVGFKASRGMATLKKDIKVFDKVYYQKPCKAIKRNIKNMLTSIYETSSFRS